MISNYVTTASVSLTEAWDDIKEYLYYPVPFHQDGHYENGKPKYNFPDGVTGGSHDLQYVAVRPNDTFIGFRLPHNVIALDVDHHDEKTGVDYLAKFIVDNGLPMLPRTYRITSRGEADPGKLLFQVSGDVGNSKVEGDLYFRKNTCPDVEILTSRHMFVGGYPGTVHQKTGKLNVCYGPDGKPCDLPYAFDLPYLPEAWVEALQGQRAKLADVDADVPEDDGQDCLAARSWWQGYRRTELTREGWTEVIKQGADFKGGQVRGIREYNATVYLKTLAIHGHHVGKVIAEACAASSELKDTIAKRWADVKGHKNDDRYCCKPTVHAANYVNWGVL